MSGTTEPFKIASSAPNRHFWKHCFKTTKAKKSVCTCKFSLFRDVFHSVTSLSFIDNDEIQPEIPQTTDLFFPGSLKRVNSTVSSVSRSVTNTLERKGTATASTLQRGQSSESTSDFRKDVVGGGGFQRQLSSSSQVYSLGSSKVSC